MEKISGFWSKLKKRMSFKRFNCSQSSPSSLALEPKSTESTIHVPRSGDSVSSESFSSLVSSRFSFSFKGKCTICLRNLKSGAGEAVFTAECSHSFHYKCITNNLKHGNLECPVCRSKWEEIPSTTPRGSSSTSGSRMEGYMTPNMVTMVSRSQNLKVTLRAPQLEVGRSSITSRR